MTLPYANKANQIWKMLDEMAESNPKGYREFLDKQMKEAKAFFSKPEEFSCVKTKIQKCNADLYVNVCAWLRVPVQENPEDAMPVTGGKLYNFDGKAFSYDSSSKVAIVALNPASLGDSAKFREKMNSNEIVQLILDVVESQNDGVIIERNNLSPAGNTFHGEKAKLLELTFPGISKQNSMGDLESLKALSMQSPNPESMQPLDILSKLASNEESMISDDIGNPFDSKMNKQPEKLLIEEINSTTESSVEDCTGEIQMSINENFDKIEICFTFPESWLKPSLQDCYVKEPNCVTLRLQTANVDALKQATFKLPMSIREANAVAKFNKKNRLLKVTVDRA